MKTITVGALLFILMAGCSKKNPVSATPPPDTTNLSVSLDSVSYDVNKSGWVYYTLTFQTNTGQICQVMTVFIEYPHPPPPSEGKRTNKINIFGPYPLNGGQVFTDKYLLTRGGSDSLYTGHYVLYVYALWDTWSGTVTGSFDR